MERSNGWARIGVTILACWLGVGWSARLDAAGLPHFPASSVWNQNISSAPLHPDSATMISTLTGLGGFGNGRMQIDFSLHVVHAPPWATSRRS